MGKPDLGSIASPGLRYVANQTIMMLRKDIVKISQFTTDFSPDTMTAGGSILIPYIINGEAKDYDRETNNYGHYDGEVKFVSMGCNKHIKHSFKFSEAKATMLPSGTNKALLLKTANSSSEAVGRRIANIVGGLITKENIPTSGTDTTTFVNEDGEEIETKSTLKFSAANEFVLGNGELTKKLAAKIRVAAVNNDLAIRRCVLALRPEKYAELLADLEAHSYGSPEAVQNGTIPALLGYKAVIEMDELNDTNLLGAIIPETAIAVGSRTIEIVDPELYRDLGTSSDPASGLVLQWRRGGDWRTGDTVATCESLFGAKLIQPTKIVRLVSAKTPATDSSSSSSSSSSGEA